MGYVPMLRGTVKRLNRYYAPKPPTLKNKVDRLARAVSRNRPERQYFSDLDNTASFAAGYSAQDINFTSAFLASSNFRDKVTGDKWQNEFMKFMFYTSNGQINHVRVVVYSHMRPSAGVSWGTTIAAMSHIPDPTAVRIYYDRTFTQIASAATQIHGQGVARVRCMTAYNSDSGVFERNVLRIAFICDADGSSDVNWSAELAFRNK